MPVPYADCLTAMRAVYPDLRLISFTSDNTDIRLKSDRVRLELLSIAMEPTLYVDCDVVPGDDPWFPGNKPAALNCSGGVMDVSILYTPGSEWRWLWANLLAHVSEPGTAQAGLNRLPCQIDRIQGYPDDRHFAHRGYTACR